MSNSRKKKGIVVKYMQANDRDRIAIHLSYIDIIEKHPYLTPQIIERMQWEGWTYTEILHGQCTQDNIFIPSVAFSCSKEIEIQGFPLQRMKVINWRPLVKKFLSTYYPQYLCSHKTKTSSQNTPHS